jgi:hypothetical protein
VHAIAAEQVTIMLLVRQVDVVDAQLVVRTDCAAKQIEFSRAEGVVNSQLLKLIAAQSIQPSIADMDDMNLPAFAN